MKTILKSAAALGIMFAASPSLAATTGPATESFDITAATPAKCDINAGSNAVTLTDDLTDDQGRANADIGQKVATGLNSAQVTAWCTGNRNSLVLERSPLISGTGVKGADGFNRATIYDIAVALAGAERTDGTNPLEGTSDGTGNGPGAGAGSGLSISRFGPSGTGATATFSNEPGSQSEATAVGNTNTSDRAAYPGNTSRLVAGAYTGTVKLTLSPGL